jgi:hypothetical protein
MKQIFEDQALVKILNDFEEIEDKKFESMLQNLRKNQPYLMSMLEASQEIFEDQEDFLEDLEYYTLMTSYVFQRSQMPVKTLSTQFLEDIEEKHVAEIDKLMDKDDFEDQLYDLFEKHPAGTLILEIYDEIFDDEQEFDDDSMEMITQLMLLCYYIVDVFYQYQKLYNEGE